MRLPLWMRYWFKSKTLRRLKMLEWVAPEAVEALVFYADPDTYVAIGFFSDPPCGEFAADGAYFTLEGERCDEDTPGARWRPGERARKALGW